jgi:hypothetical protein
MAIAYARVKGSRYDLGETLTDFTLDGSYPPGGGGYVLDFKQMGLLAGQPPDFANAVVRTGQGVLGVVTNAGKLLMLKGAAGLLVECAAGGLPPRSSCACCARRRAVRGMTMSAICPTRFAKAGKSRPREGARPGWIRKCPARGCVPLAPEPTPNARAAEARPSSLFFARRVIRFGSPDAMASVSPRIRAER